MTNLMMDLFEKEPQCSPNCLIADKKGHGGIQYTAGGWCMQRQLVQRVGELLKEKNDQALGWKSTDDVCFNKQVMTAGLGVTVIDSDRWFSELSWRRRDKKRQKLGSVGTHKILFMQTVVPSLAVYHQSFEDRRPIGVILEGHSRRSLGLAEFSSPKSNSSRVMDERGLLRGGNGSFLH
eukprot:CAMPEP_0181079906 /NCGR_PEP_ID=MMETSP1071-20121207/2279_1 /TAXON_ID=35127 /ORGANISM="Thalassiosira sp., Strain NH16" /LENGTH=178 /DNA_ID=CAMNT_0023161339 /DNA_START=243 /DNA_END=779 /DNA_ORIENTATION=-